MFIFPPRSMRIPSAELGPARGPMPPMMLPDAPVMVRVAPIGTTRPVRERERQERDRPPRMPRPAGPRPATPDFIRQLGNVAGNLFNNVLRAAAFHATGPLAPAVAPHIPQPFRPTPPPAQPSPAPQPAPTIPAQPAGGIGTTPIAQPRSTDGEVIRDPGGLSRERERSYVERARSEIVGGNTAAERQAAREQLHEDIRREYGV